MIFFLFGTYTLLLNYTPPLLHHFESPPAGSSCGKPCAPFCVTSFSRLSIFTVFQQVAGGHGVQSGTMSNEATWLYGKQSLISSVYLHRFSTVEQAVTILCYASSPIWFFDDFKKVYVDRYFEFPLTSCPISYDVPSCIPLQPFSVIQFSSFQFHFLRESSFSLLHFSVTAIFCAATRFSNFAFSATIFNVSFTGICYIFIVPVLNYFSTTGTSTPIFSPPFLFLGFESCWFWTKCSKQGQN